jgi:EpsI family protein
MSAHEQKDAGAGPQIVLSRRHMLIGGAFALASGVAIARQPRSYNNPVDAKLFDGWVPPRFGQWSAVSSSGVVLPPPDALRDRLYDNLVTRVYQAPGASYVMLLLAYNNVQDGVLQVHRPEVCYPAGGYQLSETRRIDLSAMGRTIPANIFTATGPRETEQVAYFTRLGDSFPRTWAEQRLSVVRANLDGKIPDGMMLRVSLYGTDQPAALRTLGGFADDFLRACPQPLRKLLLG